MAKECTRHFLALMRKNGIIWIRNPGCSSFEILAPIVLMVVLTIIRMQVPVTSTDQAGMLQKKYPAFLGAAPMGPGEWSHSNEQNGVINDWVHPMLCHSNYTERHHDSCEDYSIGNDWRGP